MQFNLMPQVVRFNYICSQITMFVNCDCKKVKSSHTCYRALGPELIPVYRQLVRRW